ncbi:MAG: FG-GAP-like repeat-containing protein [Candidatus Eisenbacteria bacterium]
MITGNVSGAQFGHALAGCDVNGDGFADLIVSAPGYSNGQSSEGRVQLFLGSASGISTTVTWSFEPNVVAALAGAALSSAGDVNADGRDDVLIGAPHFSNGQTAEGAAYLFLGTASGLAATASWTVEGGSTNVLFGDALANAGDVNGDGFADVLVSAPNMSAPEAGEGRVNLYLGSSSGLAATPVRSYEGNQAAAGFGRSVGTAGDVNGDGLADFLIGSPGMNGNVPGEGKAFLFLGSSVSLPFAAQLSFESSQTSPEFGGAVATAGDVNGDGFSDLAVGATKFDGAATDDGAVFVYHGAGAATSTAQFWQLSGSGNANLGAAVEMVGDVNGDGFDDAMIGVPSTIRPTSHSVRRCSSSGARLVWRRRRASRSRRGSRRPPRADSAPRCAARAT